MSGDDGRRPLDSLGKQVQAHERRHTAEYRARCRAYRARPEVRARKKARDRAYYEAHRATILAQHRTPRAKLLRERAKARRALKKAEWRWVNARRALATAEARRAALRLRVAACEAELRRMDRAGRGAAQRGPKTRHTFAGSLHTNRGECDD